MGPYHPLPPNPGEIAILQSLKSKFLNPALKASLAHLAPVRPLPRCKGCSLPHKLCLPFRLPWPLSPLQMNLSLTFKRHLLTSLPLCSQELSQPPAPQAKHF